MRLLPSSLVLLGSLVVSTAAFPTSPEYSTLSRRQSALVPPSVDPFYDPPYGYQRTKNGGVLKNRTVSTAFDQLSKAYQVLYKTTQADQDKPDATVATLFVPLKPVSPPRIMLYLTPTDTAAEDCETSYSLLTSTTSNVSTSSVGIEVLIALQKGWYVSVPDHEGSKASFISGLTEAKAALDGLRALLNFPTALPSSRGYRAVIRGYSGGGHAAGWATQYLSTYGKGLNVVGTAMGGVPVNLYDTFDQISGTANAYLDFGSFAGLANAYPELNAWQQENLYPNGTAALAYARNDTFCIDSTTTNFTSPYAGVDIYSMIKGGEQALYTGIPAKYFALSELGKKTADGNQGVLPSSVPVFMFHSKTDEVVSYAPIRSYYLDQCKQGSKIHLSTISGSTHINTFLAYLADSYIFMEKALNGTTGLDTCFATNNPDNAILSPGYIAAIGSLATGQLIGAATAAKRFRL